MKYVIPGKLDHIPEERSWYYDDMGNRIDKETGDFVVLVLKTKDIPEPELMALIKVGDEWKPKQMEFEFE